MRELWHTAESRKADRETLAGSRNHTALGSAGTEPGQGVLAGSEYLWSMASKRICPGGLLHVLIPQV